MKKNLNEKTNEYFISIDTHMNDIRKYEEQLRDFKTIIKRLKEENKELEKENIELRQKIKTILGGIK